MSESKNVRQELLNTINRYAKDSKPHSLQRDAVIRAVASQLKISSSSTKEEQQAILVAWDDLYRSGHIGIGSDLNNIGLPFSFITDKGRRMLESFSRDPANPDGYLKHLQNTATLNPVALSYITEALATYNNNCYKATAVMVGCAAESIIIELSKTIQARKEELSLPLRHGGNLKNWQVKKVLLGIEQELKEEFEKLKNNGPIALSEAFNSYWPAFTQQLRSIRNDAGHPVSVEPVSEETAHAALLIFPLQAKLATDLMSWLNSYNF